MEKNNTEDIESRIIKAAKDLFMEKGFAETNMSDIAAKVGINRPVLHYYFRTKDRLFHSLFGSIVNTLIPKVLGIIKQQDLSVAERTEHIIDEYYSIFKMNPNLPLFMVREMHRDFSLIENLIKEEHFDQHLSAIKQSLQDEMDSGRLRQVPLRFLFMTFYSLLTMPFTARNLIMNVFIDDGETYEEMLAKWKPYIVFNICNMLEASHDADNAGR